jgi:hypothetical protein
LKRSASLTVRRAPQQAARRWTWIGSAALVLIFAGITFWKINGLGHAQAWWRIFHGRTRAIRRIPSGAGTDGKIWFSNVGPNAGAGGGGTTFA